MIGRELHIHKHHYATLVIGQSILLSLFVMTKDAQIQILVAVFCGLFYFSWGVLTHRHEIRTLRLVLEYAFIGLLATVMLCALVNNL